MSTRHFFLLMIVILLYGCEYFTFKKEPIPPLDTIVNYNEVDTPPTFSVCDSLVSSEALNQCFRSTLHQEVANQLKGFTFEVSKEIDEVVEVRLQFSKEGKAQYSSYKGTAIIAEELPQLDSILKLCTQRLPKTFPAIKRGIPVATQYQLPIRIRLQD